MKRIMGAALAGVALAAAACDYGVVDMPGQAGIQPVTQAVGDAPGPDYVYTLR